MSPQKILVQKSASSTKLVDLEAENEKLRLELQKYKALFFQKEQFNTLMFSEITSLKSLLLENENARIAMNCQLQELKGNLRVYCRVRPAQNPPGCLVVPPQGKNSRQVNIVHNGKEKPFYFERVFDERAS